MTELDELRKAVGDFLSAASPPEAVRRIMASESGVDPGAWVRMANELGLHGIAAPEDLGGAGAGAAELAVVFEEAGAALLCAPLFSTVALAIPALLTSGDEAARQYVERLVDGRTTATLVLNGNLGAWDPAAVTLTARADGGGHRISGDVSLALDGHTADLLLVAADTSSGTSLFVVASGAEGLQRQPLAGLDRTRRCARLTFTDVPARLIGSDGCAAAALARTADVATVMLAAEQLGGAQRCLDTAVAYAKDRIQFGRTIGSFQAVKHRCADMLVLVEGARSAVVHAAEVADSGDDADLAVAAAVAKLTCSEAFLQVAVDSMKIHGGIGFTWEHDAHLYVRRAKSSALMFGAPDHHAQRLADLITPR